MSYVFDDDGKSGTSISNEDGMGIGFTYELGADGSCVFHMGEADDNTRATVVFSDAAHATITWENGSAVAVKFVSGSISVAD